MNPPNPFAAGLIPPQLDLSNLPAETLKLARFFDQLASNMA